MAPASLFSSTMPSSLLENGVVGEHVTMFADIRNYRDSSMSSPPGATRFAGSLKTPRWDKNNAMTSLTSLGSLIQSNDQPSNRPVFIRHISKPMIPQRPPSATSNKSKNLSSFFWDAGGHRRVLVVSDIPKPSKKLTEFLVQCPLVLGRRKDECHSISATNFPSVFNKRSGSPKSMVEKHESDSVVMKRGGNWLPKTECDNFVKKGCDFIKRESLRVGRKRQESVMKIGGDTIEKGGCSDIVRSEGIHIIRQRNDNLGKMEGVDYVKTGGSDTFKTSTECLVEKDKSNKEKMEGADFVGTGSGCAVKKGGENMVTCGNRNVEKRKDAIYEKMGGNSTVKIGGEYKVITNGNSNAETTKGADYVKTRGDSDIVLKEYDRVVNIEREKSARNISPSNADEVNDAPSIPSSSRPTTLKSKKKIDSGVRKKRCRHKKSPSSPPTKVPSTRLQRRRILSKVSLSQGAPSETGSDNPVSITNFRFKPLHGEPRIKSPSQKITIKLPIAATDAESQNEVKSSKLHAKTDTNATKKGKPGTPDKKDSKKSDKAKSVSLKKTNIPILQKVKTGVHDTTYATYGIPDKTNYKKGEIPDTTNVKAKHGHLKKGDSYNTKCVIAEVPTNASAKSKSKLKCRDQCIQVDMDCIDTPFSKRDLHSQIDLNVLNYIKRRRRPKAPRRARENSPRRPPRRTKRRDDYRMAMQKCAKYAAEQNCKALTPETIPSFVSDCHEREEFRETDAQSCMSAEKTPGDRLLEDIKARIFSCQGKCSIIPSAVNIVSHSDPRTTESIFTRHSCSSLPRLTSLDEVKDFPSSETAVSEEVKTPPPKKGKQNKKKRGSSTYRNYKPNGKRNDCNEEPAVAKIYMPKMKTLRKKQKKVPTWDDNLRTFMNEWQGLTCWE